MSDPESHTLHLLREIREDIQRLDRKVETLDRKVDKNHAEVKGRIDGLVQTLAGEMADRESVG